MTGPQGTCEERFGNVRDLLATRLDNGGELGASVCVIKDGRVAVDLWGGTADADSGRVWERDTLVNTYSVTKTVTALAALILIDRGELDPDATVAHYWPEFAAAGKRDTVVRHILSHTCGVPGWARRVSLDDIYDTQASAALLAAQEPWWRPGDGSGYQALNHGHLVGELVRRITGRTLGEFLVDELTGPCEADYWLGAPASVDARVATLVPSPGSGIDYGALSPDSVLVKTLTNPVIPPRVTTTRPFLAAELGGLNGQGNARSVATLQSIVSHGGVLGDQRYLSSSTIDRIFEPQSDSIDRVLGSRIRFGLGYALSVPDALPEIPTGKVCCWVGFGGAFVVNDLDRRMTVAYAMNKMAPKLIGSENTRAYLAAVYSSLAA